MARGRQADARPGADLLRGPRLLRAAGPAFRRLSVPLGLLGRVFSLLWGVAAPPMAGVAGITVLQSLVPLGNVLLLKGLINAVIALSTQPAHPVRPVLAWLGWLLALQAAGAGLGLLQPLLQQDLGNRVSVGLGARIAAKAQRVPAAHFERPGFYDALYRARYGTRMGFVRLFGTAVTALRAAVTLVTLGGLLLSVNPLLPLVLLVSLLPDLTLTASLDRRLWRLRSWQAPEFRRTWYFNNLFTDRAAAKELRLYGLAPHLLERWRTRDRALRARILAVEDRLHLAETAGTAVATAGFGAAFWLLLAATLAGRLSLGGFGAYIAALEGVSGAFTALLGGLRAVGESLLYVGDVQAFLDAPEEAPAPPGAPAFPQRPAAVRAADLAFAYPDGPEVLRGVDLAVRPGEKLAVVGANGAGKSTLVKLLLGLYSPTAGALEVAGRDADAYDPASRRGAATAIFQEYVRYPLTARENVGVGRVERLDDLPAISEAARLSGAEFLGELPAGWETVLNKELEGGVELSGGQWQRVATARALLRGLAPTDGLPLSARGTSAPGAGGPRPEEAGAETRPGPAVAGPLDPPPPQASATAAWLLAMDEPTAALDPLAEAAVFARFQEMAGGRTAIMVSHRLGSARLADRILVMEGGRIVEEGSHEELLRRGGLYARMFAMQAEWYAERAEGDGARGGGPPAAPDA